MANLLLVMAHADTAVKGRLCETDTLRTLFTAIEDSPEALQLTVLKAIKQLTSDPSMLEALEVGFQLQWFRQDYRAHALDSQWLALGACKPCKGVMQVHKPF